MERKWTNTIRDYTYEIRVYESGRKEFTAEWSQRYGGNLTPGVEKAVARDWKLAIRALSVCLSGGENPIVAGQVEEILDGI